MGARDHKMSFAARSIRLIAVAVCLTGCFPSFDGLTGGGATVDGQQPDSTAPPDTGLEAGPIVAPPGDASGDADGASCVIEQDAMTSKNCGRCGRDCELGACVDGQCTPYVFVSDQQPIQLALDGAYLYWTNGAQAGSVYRIPHSGAGGAKLLATGLLNPSGITVTPDKIYWLDQGSADQSGRITGSDGVVMSSALDGTGARTIGTSFKRPLSLVVDSGRVYVTEHGINDTNRASDGDVISCTIPDCADRRLHVDIAIFPMQLLLRDGSLYWTSEPSASDDSGSIWQLALGAGAKAASMFPTIKVQAYRMAFSADGSTLYYTSKNFQSITRHPLGPGEVTLLHMNFEPRAVVVDDTELFAIIANDYTAPEMNAGSLVRVASADLSVDGTPSASLKKFAVPRGGIAKPGRARSGNDFDFAAPAMISPPRQSPPRPDICAPFRAGGWPLCPPVHPPQGQPRS